MAEPGLEYGSSGFKLLTKPQTVRRERPSLKLPDTQIRKPETQIGKRVGGCLPSRVGDLQDAWNAVNVYAHTHTPGTGNTPSHVLRE